MKKGDWVKFKTKAGKPAQGIGVEYDRHLDRQRQGAHGGGGAGGVCEARRRRRVPAPFEPRDGMQAKVYQKNATNTAETRAAVKAVLEETVTPEHLQTVASRVRRNMKQVESLRSGNWCKEGQIRGYLGGISPCQFSGF